MKKYDICKDFVRKLSDENLRYFKSKLAQRLGGDVGEVVEFVQKNSEMDRWLGSARNAEEYFDMIDHLDDMIESEIEKRYTLSGK